MEIIQNNGEENVNLRNQVEQLLSQSKELRMNLDEFRAPSFVEELRRIDPTLPSTVDGDMLSELLRPRAAIRQGVLRKFLAHIVEQGSGKNKLPTIEISTPFTKVYKRVFGSAVNDWASIEITSSGYEGVLRIDDNEYEFTPDKTILTATMIVAAEAVGWGNVMTASYIIYPDSPEPEAKYSENMKTTTRKSLVDPLVDASVNMQRILDEAKIMINVLR